MHSNARLLFRIEMRKMFNYRTFWILIAIHFLLLAFSALFIREIIDNLEYSTPAKGISVRAQLSAYLFFPRVWNTFAYIAGFLNFLLSAIVIFSVCNEYAFQTLKQHIVNGMSRWQFLVSKLLLCFTLALYASVLVFCVTCVVGLVNTTHPSLIKFWDQIEFIPLLFCQTLLFLLLSACIGFIFRKGGLAIALLFLYIIVIENILAFSLPDSIDRYLPNRVISKLVLPPDHMDVGYQVITWDTGLAALAYGVYLYCCLTLY